MSSYLRAAVEALGVALDVILTLDLHSLVFYHFYRHSFYLFIFFPFLFLEGDLLIILHLEGLSDSIFELWRKEVVSNSEVVCGFHFV